MKTRLFFNLNERKFFDNEKKILLLIFRIIIFMRMKKVKHELN